MTENRENNVQRFHWQLLPEFSDLLNSLGRHSFRSWPESPDELRSELETLRLDPESDIALLGSSGDFCGYALTLPEPDIDRVVASVASRDECSGDVGKLLDFVTDRATFAHTSRIHVAIRGVPVEPLRELMAAGFKEVTGNLELTLDRQDARQIDDVAPEEGFLIRPMRSVAEGLLLTQIQNRVFENHWGFSRNTLEEIMARLELPITGPEHVLFAESAEGDIAGYIWTALEWHQDHTCGKIWMTGVVPEFRSLGLGKALLNAGVKHLLAQGAADVHLEVVEDNSPAVSIYEGMGFKRHSRTGWYEKKL